MTCQPLGAKADVEFPHLSEYLLRVHLLGASFSANWGLRNHHFCRERRHFSSRQTWCPYLLPVDSGSDLYSAAEYFPFGLVAVMMRYRLCPLTTGAFFANTSFSRPFLTPPQ